VVPAPLVLCECARVCRVRAVWCRCSARVWRVRARVRSGVNVRAACTAMMGLGVQVSMPARSGQRERRILLCGCWFRMQTTPDRDGRGLFGSRCVRRCPTLPHPVECSTIGAGGLSFRVRNGTGRFPSAMAAVTLRNSVTSEPVTHTRVGWRIRVFGCVTEQLLVCCFRYCTVDA
jgi:hypothetical protein